MRLVLNPSAPASSASAVSRAISATSSTVTSASWARSPSTKARSATWGICAATSTERGIESSASRYSANDSHDQSIPSWRAVPGMSSTASINSMRKS